VTDLKFDRQITALVLIDPYNDFISVRYGAELGYDVTVVKDAIADSSDEKMHTVLEINLPNYAGAIVTTDELIEALSSNSLPAQALSAD